MGWAGGAIEITHGEMQVEWDAGRRKEKGKGKGRVSVTSPEGTVGRVELPEGVVRRCEGFEVNGGVCDGTGFVVEGGGRFELRQI